MTCYGSMRPSLGSSNPVHTPVGGGVLERRLVPFSFSHVKQGSSWGVPPGVADFVAVLGRVVAVGMEVRNGQSC